MPLSPRSTDVDTTTTPEPLVSAEVVRSLLLLAAAAAHIAIPDPVVGLIVPVAMVLATAAVSWGLTMVTRGKVIAMRHGVDVNAFLDWLRQV